MRRAARGEGPEVGARVGQGPGPDGRFPPPLGAGTLASPARGRMESGCAGRGLGPRLRGVTPSGGNRV